MPKEFNVYEQFDRLNSKMEDSVVNASEKAVEVEIESISFEKRQELLRKLSTRGLKVTEDNKIKVGSNQLAVRSPHLFKTLMDRAMDAYYYESSGEPDDLWKIIGEGVTEELLHGVPALGHEDLKDGVYGVTFIRDSKSQHLYIQPFYAFLTDNKGLTVDILTNPSRIKNEALGEVDRLSLNQKDGGKQ